VALLLAQPLFADLLAVKAAEGGLIFRGALKVIDASGRTLDLPGQVWRTAFGICLVAEYDVETLQASAPKGNVVQREVRVIETSLIDKISGTGNRESLDQALATEISRVRRTGLPLTAFMTAIDSFDALSVEKSLPSGRKLIARFGYLLRLLTRPTDIPARFERGGSGLRSQANPASRACRPVSAWSNCRSTKTPEHSCAASRPPSKGRANPGESWGCKRIPTSALFGNRQSACRSTITVAKNHFGGS
jgi:hypothetical protein